MVKSSSFGSILCIIVGVSVVEIVAVYDKIRIGQTRGR